MMAVLPTPGAPSTATRRLPPMAGARCRAPRWEASWAGAALCAPRALPCAPRLHRASHRPAGHPEPKGARPEDGAGGGRADRQPSRPTAGARTAPAGAEAQIEQTRRAARRHRLRPAARLEAPPAARSAEVRPPRHKVPAAEQGAGAGDAFSASVPLSSRSGAGSRRPSPRRERADEVTARCPSHLPLLASDAPPGKGLGKVTGAQAARGGTQPPPRTALLSPDPK